MRGSRSLKPVGDDLVISCLEDIIEEGSPVIVRSKIIGSGNNAYKLLQSWAGHYGDLFSEYVEHPIGRDSAFRAQFLYFWFKEATDPNCPGQLVAFSDHHLDGEYPVFQFAHSHRISNRSKVLASCFPWNPDVRRVIPGTLASLLGPAYGFFQPDGAFPDCG